MRRKTEIKLSILLSCLWLVIAGCKEDDTESMPTSQIVSLANDATLGSYLTDSEGRTLYFFSRDADGNSACSGTCLDTWPVFYEPETSLEAGQGLDINDFGTITRSDGSMQTTYKGWPLYYFAQDQDAGDTAGEGVNNLWFVAKPDYTVMLSNQSVAEGEDPKSYLVDEAGNTLYLFTIDYNNQSNCEGNCLQNWPAFSSEEIVIPSILDEADFSTFTRTDGTEQLTYQGWPLYHFANDEQRGDTNGEALNNVWFVVNPEETEAAPPAPTIQLAEDETLGEILVDQEGRTLYFFSNDADGSSACSGSCLGSWPVFYTEEVIPGEGLDEADFDVITGNDGMQTTYKGWPLYYYAPAGDGEIEAPGETLGEGVNGVWFVAKPDYTVMLARQAVEEGQDPVVYLTDAYGVTLYRFTNDEEGMSNCTGNCINVWPVFPTTEELVVPSTIEMADFSTVARTDGESDHWAYQSMPLYYFANDDNSRGSTLGEGVNGVWFVVQP